MRATSVTQSIGQETPDMVSMPDKAALLAELRGRIARAVGPHLSLHKPDQACAASLGEERLDEALPWGGLLRGGLHEVGAAAYRDGPAALGFGAALVTRLVHSDMDTESRTGGMVLWCRQTRNSDEFGDLYGPGLAAFGLDPDRLILVNARSGRDVLWALEEGLKCPALTAVVGELPGDGKLLDLTASRRLQLAAEASGVSAILLRGHCAPLRMPSVGASAAHAAHAAHAVSALGAGGASAALTRWRISAAPSTLTEGYAGIGRSRWRAELIRCRGGQPRNWLLEWNHEENCFAVATPVANRPAAPRPGSDIPFGQARSGPPNLTSTGRIASEWSVLAGFPDRAAEPLRRTG